MKTNETFISFYLRANRVHIFVDALREVGFPKYICFMLGEEGKTLVLSPYPKKDYHSHRVPTDVYKGCKSMEVSSKRLCQILASMQNWDLNYSYRIPGVIYQKQNVVVFTLSDAEKINPSKR